MRQSIDIGLIIPLQQEFESAREIFRFEAAVRADGCFYYPFAIPGSSLRGIATVLLDMGTTSSAVAATRLLGRFNVRVLALVGIAGALAADLGLGDVVIAKSVDEYLHAAMATPDSNGQGFEFQVGGISWQAAHSIASYANNFRFLGGGDQYTAWSARARQRRDPALHAAIPRLAKEFPDYQVGAIATGDIVSAATSFSGWLRQHNRLRLAIEMEAGGIAQAMYSDGRADLIVVRGISDLADERKIMLDATATDAIGAGAWRRYAALNAFDLLGVLVSDPAFPWPGPAKEACGQEDASDQEDGRDEARDRIAMRAKSSGKSRIYQAGGDMHIGSH